MRLPIEIKKNVLNVYKTVTFSCVSRRQGSLDKNRWLSGHCEISDTEATQQSIFNILNL